MNSRPWTCALTLLLAWLGPVQLVQGQVLVNEALSTGSTLLDRDGDATDWIELYNSGNEPVQLEGFGLSDDPDQPYRWVFPHLALQPGEYQIVRASGKDVKGLLGMWTTVVTEGDTLSFDVGNARIPESWSSQGFDDSGWDRGPSGIGYGDGDDATQIPATLAVFARRPFEIVDPSRVTGVQLHLDFDDGFVAHVNGVEVGRANLGLAGTPASSIQAADASHEARLYQGLPISGIEVDPALLVAGENILAVQVHNRSRSSSDLTMIPFLSVGLEAPAPDYSSVSDVIRDDFHRPLHTSFRLAADETVCLTPPSGAPSSCLELQRVSEGTSVGLRDDGSAALFSVPTPGSANGTGAAAIAPPVTVSPEGGIYSPGPRVILTSSEGRVVYTLDGTDPTETSSEATGPVNVRQTSVLKTRVVGLDLVPGPIATHTYAVRSADLPVLSLSFEPRLFFDPQLGLYQRGPSASGSFPYFGANFWEDREVAVHAELLEPDGRRGIGHNVGLKIFGGWSRGHPQKSFSLFARGSLGPSTFNHRFFPDRPSSLFESVVFRNSGNDWERSMLRDGFLQRLVANTAIDGLAYRPTVVYLNGDYWGIHNLREKVNEHYLTGLSGVDPDAVDLLEFNSDFDGAFAIHGTLEAWDTLLDRLAQPDIATEQALADIARMIDLDNYIDYHLAQIYFDNRDWPGNNVKVWRERSDDGRFRWILYDTDFGWGIWDSNAWAFNTLGFALEPSGPNWPNPPWSTFVLRRLVQNPGFVDALATRLADFVNHHFDPDRVAETLTEVSGAIETEMQAHVDRWGGRMGDWRSEILDMHLFGQRRPEAVFTHFAQRFGLFTRSDVEVDAGSGGRVRINRLPAAENWAGTYWNGIPLPVEAIPDPGYRFVAWSGASTSVDRTLELDPAGGINLTATFEPDPSDPSAIVISEIQYNPRGPEGEWVELVNVGGLATDLTGWHLADASAAFTLPGISLAPGERVVICQDAEAFLAAFGRSCSGDWTFSLSNGGELIQLVNAGGAVADSVRYDDAPPWPSEPDGEGHTLALVDVRGDNGLAASWRPSRYVGGSPGDANVVLTNREQDLLPQTVEIQVYPNPSGPGSDVSAAVSLPVAGDLQIEVFDVLGRRVFEAGQSFSAGQHRVTGIRLGQAAGVYLLRVTLAGQPVFSGPVVRAR